MNNEKCPNCGKSHYSVGGSTRKLIFFKLIFKDGVDISPDRDVTITELNCFECGHKWMTSGKIRRIPQG